MPLRLEQAEGLKVNEALTLPIAWRAASSRYNLARELREQGLKKRGQENMLKPRESF